MGKNIMLSCRLSEKGLKTIQENTNEVNICPKYNVEKENYINGEKILLHLKFLYLTMMNYNK